MSKGATNTAIKDTTSERARVTGESSKLDTQLQGLLGPSTSTAGGLLTPTVSGYTDISTSGGYDPSILGTVSSGYADLAGSGGITPAGEAAITDAAADAARSTYDLAASDAQRKRSVTGGYGYNPAIEEALARAGSNAASQASQSASAQIVPLRQAGQIAGLSGLSGVGQNLATNKLSALGGLGSLYGTQQSVSQSLIADILSNLQGTAGINAGLLGTQSSLATQPGFGSNLVTGLGAVGGLASGVGGLLSGIGKVRQQP
jgi:hypothetical protein